MLTPLDQLVREHIAVHGPMPYSAVIERALYDSEFGFYSSGGRAGRRGDFLTSAEVGPLFGHVVSRAIDAEWDRLGQPEEFTFIDFGAGPGTLARAIHAASPRVADHLRYIAVERSETQRENHPDGVLSVDALTTDHIGSGVSGMVFANELLDNFAFTPIRWDGGVPAFASVDVDDRNDLVETYLVNAEREVTHLLPGRLVMDQLSAATWVRWVRGDVITRGRLVVIDYARLLSEDVEVRTYSDHGRAGEPLVGLGSKDITVDVDLEALQQSVGQAESIVQQHEWLRAHGVDELVEEGRSIWQREAGVGDLAALRAKSRIREAESLCDERGLGGFLVSEWTV